MRLARRHAARTRHRALAIGVLLPALLGVGANSAHADEPVAIDAADTGTIDVLVSSASDDVAETANGAVRLDDRVLTMTADPAGGSQKIGIRFANVGIPAGATIKSAHIEFRADEVTSVATALTIRAEAAANSDGFVATSGDLSRRDVTSASVKWSVGAWTRVGATHRTIGLSTVVQEVVSQPGWASGNALTFVIDGTGRRVAKSYENSKRGAPRLFIEYTGGTTGQPDPEPSLTAPTGYGDTRDLPTVNGNDWSGLSYVDASAGSLEGLWAVNDESMLGRIDIDYSPNATSTWELTRDNGQRIDAEGVVAVPDDAVYVVAEARKNKNGGAPNAIYRYEIAGPYSGPKLTDTWSFGNVGDKSPLPPNGKGKAITDNKGIEGVAFIPDYALKGVNFGGVPFAGSGSSNLGVLALGYESDSNIYLVALNRSTPSSPPAWRHIATIPTSLRGVAALEWDGNELWAYCDDLCDNKVPAGTTPDHFALIAKTADRSGFAQVKTFPTEQWAEKKPLEGFAISGRYECTDGLRRGWWINDAKTLRSLSVNVFGRCSPK